MQRILTGLAALVLVAGLAACGNADAAAPTAPASIDPNAVQIVARGIAFTTTKVDAAAGKPFQIVFDNQDQAPHNVAILASDGAVVFTGQVFSGPARGVYDVPALKAGTYTFRCDVHPNMTGTLTVR